MGTLFSFEGNEGCFENPSERPANSSTSTHNSNNTEIFQSSPRMHSQENSEESTEIMKEPNSSRKQPFR